MLAAVLALSGLTMTATSAAGHSADDHGETPSTNSGAGAPGGHHGGAVYWLAEETDFAFVTREGEEFGPETPLELTADLSGANEVEQLGDPDGRGSATVSLYRDGVVCWTLSVQDVQLPATDAHIHVGPAGVNGDVVVALSGPGSDGTSSGCRGADQALIDAIAADPAGYYVNVHTEEFPAGAVRGQLAESFAEPRPGDRFFLTEDLFTSDATGAKGDPIGRTLIQCTFGLANSVQCSGTAVLDDRGEVHFTATVVFDPESEELAPFDIAIVGGTRKFADAGGDVTLTELPDADPTQTLWEVRLQHLAD